MKPQGTLSRAIFMAVIVASMSIDPGMVAAETKVLARGYALGNGLTSLVAQKIDRQRALIGKFERDGMVTYFETRRGRRIKNRDEGGPKYEMDVCFKSSTGVPLIMQFGGDAPLIPGCHVPDEEESAAASARSMDDVRGEFLAASMAIEALQGVAFRKTFAAEYDALVGHAGIAAEGFAGKEAHEGTLEIDDEGNASMSQEEGGARAPTCCVGGYQHYVDVYSAPIRFSFGYAKHPALAAYRIRYGTNYFDMAWHRCNHGRCVWDMAGYWFCSMWTRQANRSFHVHNQPCRTFYNPLSQLGGHNSNDDMVLEYASVRENTHFNQYSGTCTDGARRDYTPPCW